MADDSGGAGGGTYGGGGPSDTNSTSGQQARKGVLAAKDRVASSVGGGITPMASKSTGSRGSFPVGGSDGSSTKNPNLYMGADSPIAFMNYTDAQQMYYLWDTKTRNKFMSQLGLAGYDTSKMSDRDIADTWAKYVDTSARYQVQGQHVSPWDVLAKDISGRSEAASTPKTTTATQKTYNISTAEDAAALFQGAAQTLLGRDPTKAEQARFKQILNKYEQANPATTTTTTTSVGGDVTNQSSTTSGGVAAGAQQYIASEEAKKNPEYGAYQAATNGMNWLMEMLGG